AETGAATVNAVTDDQIRALLQRAVADWDYNLAITCQAALDGSETHRAECLRVIEATRGADEGSP
ncbi:MAG: hypothetical protein GWO40_04615, partial [Gammaproteobacteria bacterium]|nr:hypothetical protein [Gammaproteobacteria bacterium]NIV50933.1 hypothetical protein [Gammaproteobacteria bacterium]NIX84843.1 hypothetical protein [Gammaproteobacteria bacterium]